MSAAAAPGDAVRPGPRNLITDVAGILVGNAEAPAYSSGTTVVLPQAPAIAAVDVSGGAPGTRETEVLGMGALNEIAHAVVLSGGSAYGLDAAGGTMAWLRDRRRGLSLGPHLIPIVPAAIIFDLPAGADPSAAGAPLPYRDLGWQAAAAAGETFMLGNAGVGIGATTADVKGGLGSASAVWQSPDGPVTVGAIAAVNPVGSPLLPGTRTFLAAPFEIAGEFGGCALPQVAPGPQIVPSKRNARLGANTVIAVVATDATLTKPLAHRLAVMAQAGIAKAVHPSHTPFDGDTVFALATGRGPALDIDRLYMLGGIAQACMARAIARGVHAAPTGLPGFPAWRDLPLAGAAR
ncbi:MAG: P1 family peptidase [Pseudomonadota bacterium]